MNSIIVKTLFASFFFTFSISNCKNYEKQNSSEIIQIKGDDAKQITLKINTVENDHVSEISISTNKINFKIYYFKDKELSYLKLSKVKNHKQVDFCINTSSMEEAINGIKLFEKNSYYYLLIPSCTEELPVYHLVKFDDTTNYEDLGIYAFKYDKQILKFKNFNTFQYDLIEKNGKISITSISSKQRFNLLYNKKFNSESQITNQDLNVINKLNFKSLRNLKNQLQFNGTWSVNCNNGLSELTINNEKGYLSLYSFNSIYINLIVKKSTTDNEFLLKFSNTSSQKRFYSDKLNIIDEEISKDQIIGKLKIIEDRKAELSWVGLYNLKLKKLEFTDKDFLLIKENNNKNPIILEKCD